MTTAIKAITVITTIEHSITSVTVFPATEQGEIEAKLLYVSEAEKIGEKLTEEEIEYILRVRFESAGGHWVHLVYSH